MAAIIAQMTRQNRERKKKRRYEKPISKCMYHLPEFAPAFDKEIHNKYLRAKRQTREKFHAENFHKIVFERHLIMDEILAFVTRAT